MDLNAFIARIHPGIPPEKRQVIVSCFTPYSFTKGDHLLKEGTICSYYHFISSGFVRVNTTDSDGNDVITGFASEGMVACELFSFFKRVPSAETITAMTDGNSFRISFEELQKAFHDLPEFREFGRAVLIHSYASLKQRMLSGFRQKAEQRYEELMQQHPEVFQHLPLKDIASYLGITDTSLSRIRKEFARK